MGLGRNIMIGIMSASILGCNPGNKDVKPEDFEGDSEKVENEASLPKNDDLSEVQEGTKKEISICLTPDQENSFTHTKALEQISETENTVLEYPLGQLFQRYEDRPHPFRVSGVGKNFEALLGKNGIERLLSETPQKLTVRQEEITSDTNYEINDTLRFPLINPLLKDDFPQNLSDQLKEEGFEKFSDSNFSDVADKMLDKTDQNNDNKKSDFIYDIVVKRAPSGKSALALYRNGKLFMATYVSVGLNDRRTKTGQFKILGKEPYKRSHKYDNAPMPLSLHFGDGFAFHQGRVTGGNLSHGCVRIPGAYVDVLYSLVKDHLDTTDIYISKNLY